MGLNPESKSAHAFAKEICMGNAEAEAFCDLWYNYCHAIDDLIDTKEDGRPTMNNEDILQIFIQAAMMYNCSFYRKHQSVLFSAVLTVTNMYADSVLWERSPIKRRRDMADTLRTCGDEMMNLVAMIIGGWKHVRDLSPRIRDQDWVLQHDELGNPT